MVNIYYFRTDTRGRRRRRRPRQRDNDAVADDDAADDHQQVTLVAESILLENPRTVFGYDSSQLHGKDCGTAIRRRRRRRRARQNGIQIMLQVRTTRGAETTILFKKNATLRIDNIGQDGVTVMVVCWLFFSGSTCAFYNAKLQLSVVKNAGSIKNNCNCNIPKSPTQKI